MGRITETPRKKREHTVLSCNCDQDTRPLIHRETAETITENPEFLVVT